MKTLYGKTQSYRSLYSIVDQVKSRGLVIYGAGFWGKLSWQIFTLFDVAPICFCDDDPDKQGTWLTQNRVKVQVLSLDEAAEKYPDAVYIAASSNDRTGERVPPREVMNTRLRERELISECSGFHPIRYLFLLDGGLEALKHPEPSKAKAFQIESFKSMVVLNGMSNSGSAYFETLMDGHPNIVNILFLGALFPLQEYYQKRLQYLEGEELVLELASQMSPYFIYHFSGEMYFSPVIEKFVVNQDAQPEKRVYIEPARFVTALHDVLSCRGKVSFADLLKAVYAAYANSTGKVYDPGQTYWIFFDRHKTNYDLCEMDELLTPDDFDRLEYWFVIREPIQHWFSLSTSLREIIPRRERRACGRTCVGLLSCDLGLMLEKTAANKGKIVKVIRFEDAKKKMRETMQAVSKWMDIPFDEVMLDTTINGIVVYFPSRRRSAGDTKKTISSSDTTAVDRKDFSEYMTSYDIFRLNLAFQNFKRAYGYDCDVPAYRDFSLEFLRELYRYPFLFDTLLNRAGTEREAIDNQPVEECPSCHEYIVDLFLNYMQKDEHELFTDMIRPQDAGEEP